MGSAWGLPVVAAGKERMSALSLSEKLQAPGIVSFGTDPFSEEHLRELETLGIGPLGRYLGGEPIKPIRLFPEDFFVSVNRRKINDRAEKTNTANTAELFCTALEFKDTHWVTEGAAPEIFHGHLEFLRTWGFTGGVSIDEAALAPQIINYIHFLQKNTACEKSKIIVLVSRHFFETQLNQKLPMAKISADITAGEIPVNYNAGNVPVLSQNSCGLGIALYEDLASMLRVQKARCDILVAVNTGSQKNQRSYTAYAEEITAQIKLTVSTAGREKEKKGQTLNSYMFRNCSESLQFPANFKAGYGPATVDFRPELKGIRSKPVQIDAKDDLKRIHIETAIWPEIFINRKTAAARELVPQWEPGSVEKTAVCFFTVNSKFSGLHAADFKEEQALFYAQPEKLHYKPSIKPDPPPVRNNTFYTGLNETQLKYFIHWRNECRRGYIRIMPDSMYIETYIWLYAKELALCMGKEGPLQHFTALMQLFHACGEHYPETAVHLCKYCVDFAVIYDITSEAFPILLDELHNNGWFNETHREIGDTEDLLVDCALCHFFIQEKPEFDAKKHWPLIKNLILPRILARKGNDRDLPVQFCRTLTILDTQLRREWNRSFFAFFLPPLFKKSCITAFENSRSMGDSSYTVLRPGFLSHQPLLTILAALALEPEKNPLPGIKTRLYPLSLENELIEELRRESNEVREMLTPEDNLCERQTPVLYRQARIEYKQKEAHHSDTAYSPVNKRTLLEFMGTLNDTDRNLIKSIMQGTHHPVPDTAIDIINSAFFGQFGDLLIETAPNLHKLTAPSIYAEYAAILEGWE